MTAFFDVKFDSLNPHDLSKLNAATIEPSILSQLSSNFLIISTLKFFIWNLILSLNKNKHVFRIKSVFILNPQSYTFFSSSSIAFLASLSLFSHCEVVLDINKSEKLNFVPPLLVLTKISNTSSSFCESSS